MKLKGCVLLTLLFDITMSLSRFQWHEATGNIFFLLPPWWDASPSQGYPPEFRRYHLYTWVERGIVVVKCLAQEHNTMSTARTRTRTTRSGVEHTNHEAAAPPASFSLPLTKAPGDGGVHLFPSNPQSGLSLGVDPLGHMIFFPSLRENARSKSLLLLL